MRPESSTPMHSLSSLSLHRAAPASMRRRFRKLCNGDVPPSHEAVILLLSEDPMTGAWILKRANGSYYGLRSTVQSIGRAVEVLGADAVAHMIASIGPEANDEEVPPASSDAERTLKSLSRHSLAVAFFNRTLAGDPADQFSEAYTAGLLHELGKHVLLLNHPDEAVNVYSASSLWDQIKGADLRTVERLAFGASHTEVGEFMGRKLHYPQELVDVLGRMGSPDPGQLPPREYPHLWLTYASDIYAEAHGYASGKPGSKEECRQHPVWEILVADRVIEFDSVTKMFDALERSRTEVDEHIKNRRDSIRLSREGDLPPSRVTRTAQPPSPRASEASEGEHPTQVNE